MFRNVNKIFEKVQNCDLFSSKNVRPKRSLYGVGEGVN